MNYLFWLIVVPESFLLAWAVYYTITEKVIRD